MRVVDTWHNKDRTKSARYGQGSRWMAVWAPTPGVEKKKLFKTKDAAKAFLGEVAADKALGHDGLKPDVEFSEYARRWLDRQVHQRSGSATLMESRVRLHIIPAFADLGVRQIGRGHVQAGVARWSAGLAPSTVKTTYTYLSGIMSEAVLDGIIRSSPCVKIKLPALPQDRVQPPAPEVVQALTDALNGPYQQAAVFAAATGMRPGEWRGLTRDRVDLEGGWVTVDRQYAGASAAAPDFGPLKTMASYRRIKIGPATVALLRSIDPGAEGLLFHTAGTGITRAKASQVWRRVRGEIPEAGKGWHQLRHFHASQLIAGGASPVAVAHRLGHKDATETLQTYAHLWPDDDERLAVMSDGLIRLDRHETATA